MVRVHGAVADNLNAFFRAYPELTYKRGEVILRAEDMPYGAYYLAQGFVRQYLISSSGEMFIVHIYKPGSFFPLTWILNDTPNVFSYDAMTPCRIRRAPKGLFVSFLREHPDVLLYGAQKLAAGIQGLLTRVTQLVLDDAYTKTLLLLVYYAQNFGTETQEGIELTIPLTHREIAAWIGTTRETASLQVEHLIKSGLVRSRGRHLIIADMQKLLEETNKTK